MAVLKHDLPCKCSVDGGINDLDGTAWCQGKSAVCTLSSLGVFIPISIIYLVAAINVALYIRLQDFDVERSQRASKWMISIAIGVPLLGVIMTFLLDFDPVSAQLASLVRVRDSFSCSPRFPSLWSEFLFKQIHFLTGTLITAGASLMTVKYMLEVSHKIGASKSKSETVLGAIEMFWAPLRKANGVRLFFLGLFCIVLALGNLVVSVQTVSLMQQFGEEAAVRQECLLEVITNAETNHARETEEGFRCSTHDDCISDAEYCSSERKCKPCYLCAYDKDGVGNICPINSCKTTSRMDSRQFCIFTNCAPIISKLASDPVNLFTVSTILSGEGCMSGSCGGLEAELITCINEERNHPSMFVKKQAVSCMDIPAACTDPFLQLEGCQCSTNEYTRTNAGCQVHTNKYGKSPGCYPVDPGKCFAAVEKWNSEHEEVDHLDDLLEDPYLMANLGNISGIILYKRSGCCYDTSPFYSLNEACSPPIKISNREMMVSYFFVNCICLVCPLLFISTDNFKKSWLELFRAITIFTTVGKSSKVDPSLNSRDSKKSYGAESVVVSQEET